MNHIEIFELCKRLAILLGDKEAIADLKLLYERHPEMFKDIKEVSHVINEVVKEPDLIVKNPNPRSDKDFIAGKQLDNEKMGEVGIRNDNGTNIIFHANNKRIKNMDLLAKKEAVNGRDAHTPYTQAQSLDGRLVQENISTTANSIIPNSNKKKKVATIKQEYNKTKAEIESLKSDWNIRVVATVLELMNPNRYGFEVVNGTKQALKDLGYSAGDTRNLIEFGVRLLDHYFQDDYDLKYKTSISTKIMDKMSIECYELVEGRNEGYEKLSKESTDKAKTMINNRINKELKNLKNEYTKSNERSR